MIGFLKDELKSIGHFLRRNREEITIAGCGTLFLVLNRYRPVGNAWQSDVFYYALLPILVIVLLLRENPLDFGLRRGNVKVWAFYVAVTCLIAAPLLYLSAPFSSLRGYYRAAEFNYLQYFLSYVVILASSEFFYRGFLLFGLKKRLREASILVQMIPFVFVHFGKPEIETISTIVTGIYFGYVAYRGDSYWPVFIIHLFINVFFVFLVNLTP